MTTAITIIPGHIWSIVDVDLKTAQLTDNGNAELSALIHEGICEHRIRSSSQWELSRWLIKVRNLYCSEIVSELRDLVQVNTTDRTFY